MHPELEIFLLNRMEPNVANKKRVYLCGPMTGYAELNRPAFEEAKRILKHRGFTVMCPHAVNEALGVDYSAGNQDGYSERGKMLTAIQDFTVVASCDAVYVLPGTIPEDDKNMCGSTNATIKEILTKRVKRAVGEEAEVPGEHVHFSAGGLAECFFANWIDIPVVFSLADLHVALQPEPPVCKSCGSAPEDNTRCFFCGNTEDLLNGAVDDIGERQLSSVVDIIKMT